MKYPKYKYFFAVADFVLLMASFVTIEYTMVILNISPFDSFVHTMIVPVWFFIPISLMFIFIFHVNNLYKHGIIITIVLHSLKLLKSISIGFTALILLSFLIKISTILNSRIFFISTYVFVLILFVIMRALILRTLYIKFGKTKVLKRKLLIVGAGKSGQLFCTNILLDPYISFDIVGFIDDTLSVGKKIINDIKIIGKTNDIPLLTDKLNVQEIVIAIDKISHEQLLSLLDVCRTTKAHIKVHSDLFEIISEKIETEKYAKVSVVNASARINLQINLTFKRIVDIVLSLIGLILLSPFFALVAIIIKATSKGPVFHIQKRIGYMGKEFDFYKFRSMTVENEEDNERKKLMIDFMKKGKTQFEDNAKIVNTARITGIGKILRKFSLDELPQLINVLKGDMSLVGPRPCLPYEYENYDEWQKRRLTVLPGCTGVWQVFGRGKVSFIDSVILDIYYIHNMSPWYDLQLIIQTIPAMLLARGGK